MTSKSSPRLKSENKRSRKAFWLVLLPPVVLLAAGPARQEKTLATTPNPRISLSNVKGQVVVRGWDKPEVHVVWTNPSPQSVEVDPEVMPATGPAERINLTTHALGSKFTGNEGTVDYTLEVPVGSNLEIRNPQGSVRIEKLQGDTSVESVGGTISVSEVTGHLAVRSVGGDVEIIRPSGRVEASSITGNLHFVAPVSPMLRGITTSGKITYEGDFVSGADYMLSAYSGDVDIFCPPTASFELSAKTVRGRLENALPLKPKSHVAFPLPAANGLFGTHNNGKAMLELSSFSGTIRIRPQP